MVRTTRKPTKNSWSEPRERLRAKVSRGQNHERGDPRALEVSRNGRTSASTSCQAPMLIKMESLRASHALRRARPGAQRRRLTSSEEILRRQALLILSLLPTSERDHRAGERHHRERDHRVGERDHGREAFNGVGSRLRKKSSEDKPSSS